MATFSATRHRPRGYDHAAARTFNVLASEGRRVVAFVIPS
jgi:hypothetical protein